MREGSHGLNSYKENEMHGEGDACGRFMELIPLAELERCGEIKLKKSGLKVRLRRKLPKSHRKGT